MAPSAVRQKQKERTRERLVSAAREAFAAQGFERSTIREIARRAGVATGTVFVHFPDKQALLAQIFHETLTDVLDEAWSSLPAAPVADQLAHLAGRLYQHYAAQPDLARVLVKESLFMGGAPGQQLDSHRLQFLARVEDLLSAGGSQWKTPPSDAARVFFALYFATLVAGLRGELGEVGAWKKTLEDALALCSFTARGAPAGVVRP
ncbi:MAG: TetR/AcrR family transcriptional regulator [Pseudomonadales bacterium]